MKLRQITKMVKIIIGKRNTGKSMFYEQLLEQTEQRIYFGTLLYCDNTSTQINRHKLRRDDKWVLFETSGHIDRDIKVLIKFLTGLHGKWFCMIDSLMNWCISCSDSSADLLSTVEVITNGLIFLINRFPNHHWFILDNTIDDYSNYPILQEAYTKLYNQIKSCLDNVEYLDWRESNGNSLD
jgi:adenosyl cobinamide kinase/adenosyl cobinamide phosphate guanylyltransferase